MIIITDRSSHLRINYGIVCSVGIPEDALCDAGGIILFDANNEQLYVKL